MSLSDMKPTESGERLFYLDVLRGVALFGILAGNIRAMNAPLAVYGYNGALFPGTLDVVVQSIIFTLFQGKGVAVFSTVFGIGFAIMMERADARGTAFLPIYLRRLLVMALFGIVHSLLIWWGDILLTYVVHGAILLLFRRASQRTLVTVIVSLTLVAMVMYARMFLFPPPAPAGGAGLDIAAVQQTIAVYNHGTLSAIFRENFAQWRESLWSGMLPPIGLYPLTMFLVGVLIWRSRILLHLDSYIPQLKRVCAICLPLGLVLNLALATGHLFLPPRPGGGLPWVSALLVTGIWLVFMTLAAGYLSGIALLVQSPRWAQRLQPLALAGRMTLTNYVLQSVLFACLFIGTGLYGHVGPAMGLLLTIGGYALEVVFSVWWMERFNLGPLEWVWRTLTYGQRSAMRKTPFGPPATAVDTGGRSV